MSQVKSSNENLVLNADGTGKEIKLQNNGTTNVTVASDGDVGIGTSSPVRGPLHIHKNDTSDSQLHLTNTATGSTSSDGLTVWSNSNYCGLWGRENVPMRFATNGSERIRILSSGGITFNGDTAAANALDDYEEGTWTPQLKFGGNNTGMTYSQNAGTYVKVGAFVHLSFRITLTNKGTSAGIASITGLPFVCKNLTGNYGAGVYGYTNNWGDSTISSANLMNTIDPSGSTIWLRKINTSGNYGSFGEGSFQNDTDMLMTIAYRV